MFIQKITMVGNKYLCESRLELPVRLQIQSSFQHACLFVETFWFSLIGASSFIFIEKL